MKFISPYSSSSSSSSCCLEKDEDVNDFVALLRGCFRPLPLLLLVDEGGGGCWEEEEEDLGLED